jgi:hypothetical protein
MSKIIKSESGIVVLLNATSAVLYRTSDNFPNRYTGAFEDIAAAGSNLSGRLAISVNKENIHHVYGSIGREVAHNLKAILKALRTLNFVPSDEVDVIQLKQLEENLEILIHFFKKHERDCDEPSELLQAAVDQLSAAVKSLYALIKPSDRDL